MAYSALRTRWTFSGYNLAKHLATAFTTLNAMLVELYYSVTVFQTATPTNGGTTVLTDAVNDAHLVCTPGGTIASHTFTMPTNANSRIGQRVVISTSAQITAITISGSGLTITKVATGLAAGASIQLQKVASNVWRQVSL